MWLDNNNRKFHWYFKKNLPKAKRDSKWPSYSRVVLYQLARLTRSLLNLLAFRVTLQTPPPPLPRSSAYKLKRTTWSKSSCKVARSDVSLLRQADVALWFWWSSLTISKVWTIRIEISTDINYKRDLPKRGLSFPFLFFWSSKVFCCLFFKSSFTEWW